MLRLHIPHIREVFIEGIAEKPSYLSDPGRDTSLARVKVWMGNIIDTGTGVPAMRGEGE
ncbi:MAG: hypothetical protein JW882_15900 [Deltaproteobacteria bacterium]|nr:hypothetical protein [Deltaproteobacteria bacterium]